jgi:hypothetical protein
LILFLILLELKGKEGDQLGVIRGFALFCVAAILNTKHDISPSLETQLIPEQKMLDTSREIHRAASKWLHSLVVPPNEPELHGYHGRTGILKLWLAPDMRDRDELAAGCTDLMVAPHSTI